MSAMQNKLKILHVDVLSSFPSTSTSLRFFFFFCGESGVVNLESIIIEMRD
jgi:hypothetical protein